MSTRKTKEEWDVDNAIENDLITFRSQKQREEYLRKRDAYKNSPEGKINAAARLVLQRRNYMETSGTMPLHKVYEIFYTDTTNLIKKQFEEYVVPTIETRLQTKIDAAVEKHYKLLSKSKVEERIQSIIAKLKEAEIVKTPEDEHEQREILIKKIKSNIARELPKEGLEKIKSKIANEVISSFAVNFYVHIDLLDKFDLAQNTMHRDSAKNYVNQLFEFLQTLTSEYDLVKYFKNNKIKLEGCDNNV